jgi:hypothetical protein
MFTKWFGTRTLRQPAKAEYFFRPELEALEDRLPPSSLQGMGGNNGNGNGSDHVNIHDNIHITNSFNGSTLTNSFNGMFPGVFFLGQGQQAAVGQLLVLSSLLATELSNSNLGSLIDNEIALAVDKFLLTQPGIMTVPSLVTTLNGDISALNTAIATNPLESTPIGQAVGMLAMDVTTDALMAAQPPI